MLPLRDCCPLLLLLPPHARPPTPSSAPRARRASLPAAGSGSASGGITFQRLFQRCRERFLVSNPMLLKAFLTEFTDHELLATK